MTEERSETAKSLCIMLLPDKALRDRRPDVQDIHLTVAYLGHHEPYAEQAKGARFVLNSVAGLIGSPIPAVANGSGLFPDRGGRYAVVDLIDGIGTFEVRNLVEVLFGENGTLKEAGFPKIDYTHGFTPHITREYAMPDGMTVDMLVPSDPIPFTFNAIGVWHGDHHYEVSL